MNEGDIESVLAEWAKDTEIDKTALADEALKASRLHSKYLTAYSRTRIKYLRKKKELKDLQTTLFSYYRGDLNNPEDLARIQRQPWPKTTVREEALNLAQSDEQYSSLSMVVSYLEELCKVYEEIIQSVNRRNYNINNAINFLRFTNGA